MKLIATALIFIAAAAAQPKGKELYVKYSCYACHGFDGHGGAGAKLVPMKLMLPVFTAYIRSPRLMPAYREKVISDAELAEIWTYIKTIPESPPASRIAFLEQFRE